VRKPRGNITPRERCPAAPSPPSPCRPPPSPPQSSASSQPWLCCWRCCYCCCSYSSDSSSSSTIRKEEQEEGRKLNPRPFSSASTQRGRRGGRGPRTDPFLSGSGSLPSLISSEGSWVEVLLLMGIGFSALPDIERRKLTDICDLHSYDIYLKGIYMIFMWYTGPGDPDFEQE